jgi:serine protease Do
MILALAAPAAAAETPEGALVGLPSLAPVVEKAEPAVVHISAKKVVKGNKSRLNRGPFGGPEDLFDRFLGPGQRPDRKETSLGSGFIFDQAGYIITNNHMVEGAEDVVVRLSSGEEIHADIIGRDPKTDLALLKLKKEAKYPFLALGDSDKLKIGDWVVAIGNPYDLDHTVTTGILSARGRSIGAGPYDDFLQTDASINPGNSGGPLLNLAGEVIGINTAIVADNGGGSVGIGFAIPTNMAKKVVDQLKDGGRVVRGWIGVVITKVTPDLARSFGLEKPAGALISEVDPEGPSANKARHDDIVLKFDGHDIKDWRDLSPIVAGTPVGKKVKMQVFRDKKEVTLDLTVAELKEDPVDSASGAAGNGPEKLGLTLREITPEVASRQNLTQREGLLITDVDSGSAAAESGLSAGDIIVEIDSKPVKTRSDYNKAVAGKKKDDVLRLLVKRGANNMYFTITVDD